MERVNIRQATKISYISVLTGLIYTYLAAFMLKDYTMTIFLHSLCVYLPLQFVIVFLIEKFLSSKVSFYIIILFLINYWFFIYRLEFIEQIACWSTFSEEEILWYSLDDSFLPIVISIIIFSFIYHKKIKKAIKYLLILNILFFLIMILFGNLHVYRYNQKLLEHKSSKTTEIDK